MWVCALRTSRCWQPAHWSPLPVGVPVPQNTMPPAMLTSPFVRAIGDTDALHHALLRVWYQPDLLQVRAATVARPLRPLVVILLCVHTQTALPPPSARASQVELESDTNALVEGAAPATGAQASAAAAAAAAPVRSGRARKHKRKRRTKDDVMQDRASTRQRKQQLAENAEDFMQAMLQSFRAPSTSGPAAALAQSVAAVSSDEGSTDPLAPRPRTAAAAASAAAGNSTAPAAPAAAQPDPRVAEVLLPARLALIQDSFRLLDETRSVIASFRRTLGEGVAGGGGGASPPDDCSDSDSDSDSAES